MPLVIKGRRGSLLSKPRSISVLFGALVVLVWYALKPKSDNTLYSNTWRGLIAAAVMYVCIGTVHLPTGPFIRPHPVFWKGILAISILYLLMLVFMLFHELGDARQLVAFLDPSLGKSLPEKNYAENCAFTWTNVKVRKNQFSDVIVSTRFFHLGSCNRMVYQGTTPEGQLVVLDFVGNVRGHGILIATSTSQFCRVLVGSLDSGCGDV